MDRYRYIIYLYLYIIYTYLIPININHYSGYENRYPPDSDEYLNGTSRLIELLLSNRLKADVVKDATYSQVKPSSPLTLS